VAELDSPEIVVPEGLGVAQNLKIPAWEYLQGGRPHYDTIINMTQLPAFIVDRPNPDKPLEGNRRVDANRAKKFGTYVIDNDDWVSPAITVRVPANGVVKFDTVHRFENGTAWGWLTIPLAYLFEIKVVDGQHRTLGTYDLVEILSERKRRALELMEKAKKNGGAEYDVHENQYLKARNRFDDLSREHMSVEIVVVDVSNAKQIFADINNNAKGVNPDYTTILDQRDVINRIAAEMIEEHPLLQDRVELGQSTRMTASNPNFIGAKAVADIVRAVHVGVTGRVGTRVEDELSRNQAAAAQRVKTFLDVLLASFRDLRAIANGELEPIALRAEDSDRRSMLGSSTMLRALAGVYRELTLTSDTGTPMTRSQVQEFFSKLEPLMRQIPITPESVWTSTGAFLPEKTAPQATQGAIGSLVVALADWARTGIPKPAKIAA
jgi:hypothetical protein